MAKELPYFQFEPAEYISGSIQFCSFAAQGLFINILAVYWQRSCNLTVDQVNKRFHEPDLLSELITENIIKVEDGSILIQFLYNQLNNVAEIAKKRSQSGKKGMAKRWQSDNKPITSVITKPLQEDNKRITIREDKIREDKIKGKERKGFQKPEISDLQKYFAEKAQNWTPDKIKTQADKFYNHYLANGWKVGKNPMKSWQAAASGWISRDLEYNSIKPNGSPEIKPNQKYDPETNPYSEFDKY